MFVKKKLVLAFLVTLRKVILLEVLYIYHANHKVLSSGLLLKEGTFLRILRSFSQYVLSEICIAVGFYSIYWLSMYTDSLPCILKPIGYIYQ
jgi:hypothetical protein